MASGGVYLVADLGGLEPFLMVVFVIAAMLLVLRLTGRRIQSIQKQTAEWRNELAERCEEVSRPSGVAPGASSELNKVYVELHDFTREVEGRLDTKIANLRQLLEEADRVEARMREAMARAAPEAAAEPATDETSAPANDARSRTASRAAKGKAKPRKRGTEDDADAKVETAPDSEEPLDAAGEPTEGSACDSEGAEPKKPTEKGALVDIVVGDSGPISAERVLELHREGSSAAEIAQATGLPKGEVELMINLRQSEKTR